MLAITLNDNIICVIASSIKKNIMQIIQKLNQDDCGIHLDLIKTQTSENCIDDWREAANQIEFAYCNA